MRETIAIVGFASGLAAALYGWRQAHWRRLARRRLELFEAPREALSLDERRTADVPFTRRIYFPYWLVAILVGGLLYYVFGLHLAFAAMFAVLVGLLGSLLETMRVQRKMALIEVQLSDAIDIIVGSLRAGAGVTDALASAMAESREPLRSELHEVLNRLRLGDDPAIVFKNLMRRVPLETFGLFGATLITHWEVGGSLAPPMASVGRTIRDRLEVARRIRALSTQSRVSTMAVLAVTYFIAAIIWRNDPERMQNFLATSIGRGLVVAAVILQGVGLVWSAWLGRVKF
jgi:Flp pilus assembly protein TadB